ncbi:MAG TPA: DUF3108 domain-containing protein [Candidatus Acidoferrum sp.]|jgi:hypothetical protein
MSNRPQAAVAIIVALVCTAGAMYWLHIRDSRSQSALASPRLPDPVEAPKADAPVTTSPESVPATSTNAPAAKITSQPTTAAGMPLRTGEVLEFTASVAKVSNVANLRLQVAERRDFLGKSAWHLQAFAHTQNPLRMVFELDDQFDSYCDAANLSSLQYEMHLSERGQKVESIQRLTATGKEPAPANVTEARVLPGTRDPLGMMQYLRHVDWTRTPSVHSPVYDGHNLYDVRATSGGGSESITVPAGTYTASKIAIRVFNNGQEVKDSSFNLYLANDAQRTPVLLEATLPFAVARVELAKAQ